MHRDIKPGNLLLGTDLVLKISDFGVADIISEYGLISLQLSHASQIRGEGPCLQLVRVTNVSGTNVKCVLSLTYGRHRRLQTASSCLTALQWTCGLQVLLFGTCAWEPTPLAARRASWCTIQQCSSPNPHCQVYDVIARADYEIPDGLPPALEAILRGLLDIDTRKRLTVEKSLRHE